MVNTEIYLPVQTPLNSINSIIFPGDCHLALNYFSKQNKYNLIGNDIYVSARANPVREALVLMTYCP